MAYIKAILASGLTITYIVLILSNSSWHYSLHFANMVLFAILDFSNTTEQTDTDFLSRLFT